MCSDSNKKRGWREGERERSKEREGDVMKGEESHRIVLTDYCRTWNQEEEKCVCITRTLLISCFDFHKTSIILNHPSPPPLALYA